MQQQQPAATTAGRECAASRVKISTYLCDINMQLACRPFTSSCPNKAVFSVYTNYCGIYFDKLKWFEELAWVDLFCHLSKDKQRLNLYMSKSMWISDQSELSCYTTTWVWPLVLLLLELKLVTSCFSLWQCISMEAWAVNAWLSITLATLVGVYRYDPHLPHAGLWLWPVPKSQQSCSL